MAVLLESWLAELVLALSTAALALCLWCGRRYLYCKLKGAPYVAPAILFGNFRLVVLGHKSVGELLHGLYRLLPESTAMAATEKGQETMATDLGKLLDARDNAMVTLVAGETRLAMHRAVLADRSPVFAAMFRHDTLEASIPDVEGPVLQLLLAFMYSLRAPQLPSMAPQLLAAADKYGVRDLKAACEQQVAAQLSVETAAATAVLAVRHCCDSLRPAAISFIKEHWVQVMATQGWADAIRTQPEDMVEVHRLLVLAEPPAETSAAVAATNSWWWGRTTTGAHNDLGLSPSAAHLIPPPDDAAVSRLQSLPGEEKARWLIEAAEQGNMKELRTLLAAGADVGVADGAGWTTLHHAAARGHVEAVRSLVASGADVVASDCWQCTPLHYSARNGYAAVVKLLVESHADPNARTSFGRTPLHLAAERGHAEAAAALLKAGATRGATDHQGSTPLYLARQRGHHQLLDILK